MQNLVRVCVQDFSDSSRSSERGSSIFPSPLYQRGWGNGMDFLFVFLSFSFFLFLYNQFCGSSFGMVILDLFIFTSHILSFWPISGREDPMLIYCSPAPTLSAPETTALNLPTLDSGIPRTSIRSSCTEVHQGYIPRIVSALSGLCPLTSGLTGRCKQGN